MGPTTASDRQHMTESLAHGQFNRDRLVVRDDGQEVTVDGEAAAAFDETEPSVLNMFMS